ncbi:MAG: SDR family oxidoreductase [Salibacteraceae bacterium]
MKVFISGASGLVGGNCYRYFKEKGMDVVGSHFKFPLEHTVPFDTLDLNNTENFDLEAFSPDYIIHCGALTWVDYCEDHQDESYSKTVQSTKNLLTIAEKTGAKLIYISTDYVFDGKNGPYSETDDVNPVNIYGEHKLEGERLTLSSNPENLSIRITNVYGTEARNKNFVMRLVDNIGKGEEMELKLPFDQYATPINAHDIARALYHLIEDKKSGIYNIASTDYVNRIQLAQRVLNYFPNHKVNIVPVSTKEFNPPADRPLLGGLKTDKFLSEYPMFKFTNVDDFLKQIGS